MVIALTVGALSLIMSIHPHLDAVFIFHTTAKGQHRSLASLLPFLQPSHASHCKRRLGSAIRRSAVSYLQEVKCECCDRDYQEAKIRTVLPR
jgi:hypothetical protein